MPKLQEYVAPTRELRPENQGYQAFETAGRRVGGMYREAASGTVAAAKAGAQALVDKAQWPFTLFELKRRFTEPEKTTETTGAGGVGGFSVRKSRSSLADEQFAPRVMPNLYAANLASGAYDVPYNPLSRSLSPEGAHLNTLDSAAASLTNQLRGLIGSGDRTGGTLGPSPNQDAINSAEAWGRTIAGVPVPTSYTPADTGGGDYGGGGDSFTPATNFGVVGGGFGDAGVY